MYTRVLSKLCCKWSNAVEVIVRPEILLRLQQYVKAFVSFKRTISKVSNRSLSMYCTLVGS